MLHSLFPSHFLLETQGRAGWMVPDLAKDRPGDSLFFLLNWLHATSELYHE